MDKHSDRADTGPFDLSRTPVHIPSVGAVEHSFQPLAWFGFDGPSFGRYVSEICGEANPGRLVMIETMETDWPTWERHTAGDELVIILEGEGTFYQQFDPTILDRPFKPGDTFLNPKGIWHTADVSKPMRAIYITPCPGTENKPRD